MIPRDGALLFVCLRQVWCIDFWYQFLWGRVPALRYFTRYANKPGGPAANKKGSGDESPALKASVDRSSSVQEIDGIAHLIL
jgi:hypothetical protein